MSGGPIEINHNHSRAESPIVLTEDEFRSALASRLLVSLERCIPAATAIIERAEDLPHAEAGLTALILIAGFRSDGRLCISEAIATRLTTAQVEANIVAHGITNLDQVSAHIPGHLEALAKLGLLGEKNGRYLMRLRPSAVWPHASPSLDQPSLAVLATEIFKIQEDYWELRERTKPRGSTSTPSSSGNEITSSDRESPVVVPPPPHVSPPPRSPGRAAVPAARTPATSQRGRPIMQALNEIDAARQEFVDYLEAIEKLEKWAGLPLHERVLLVPGAADSLQVSEAIISAVPLWYSKIPIPANYQEPMRFLAQRYLQTAQYTTESPVPPTLNDLIAVTDQHFRAVFESSHAEPVKVRLVKLRSQCEGLAGSLPSQDSRSGSLSGGNQSPLNSQTVRLVLNPLRAVGPTVSRSNLVAAVSFILHDRKGHLAALRRALSTPR